MRRTVRCLLTVTAMLCVFSSFARGQSEIQTALKDFDIAPHWIYNDLPKAFEQAKATGKPLLVVLRCVPCPPGKALDQQVMQPGKEMLELEKKFVCVRVVQTNGLDLKLFQYDYDMSWSAMVLNADRVIYGRYGSRTSSGPGSDAILSLAAFRNMLQRSLTLHAAYPGNRQQLTGKLGKDPEYAVPERTPGLQDKPSVATTRQNCIHCHMVKEYALRAKWEANKLTAADLWVYPMPDRIGLTMDLEDGLRVQALSSDSAAAQAGIAVGDELIAMGGQPLTSLADIQWVLHNAPNEGKLLVALRRDGKLLEKSITVSGDWKQSDIAWRASSWYGLRQGLKLEPLAAADKLKRGLAADALALTVKGLFGKGAPKLQQAGLKVNDLIVAVNGNSSQLTESEFLAELRLKHGPGDAIKLTILRGDNRQELAVPLW